MSLVNHPLKIVIAVHHFPPTFKGGAEWRAHRTAKWLQNQGHIVNVICIEGINDSDTTDLRWVDDEFDSLTVRRLFLNLDNASDPTRWEYNNPWIESHLIDYLAEVKPDIFHLISGYLMTAAAIKAAKYQGIPIVVTLTDFWFLCRHHTLYRSCGQICLENTSLDCLRCTIEEKRRFRWLMQRIPGLTYRIWQLARSLPVISAQVARFDDRVKTLQAVLNEVEVAICPSNFLKQTYIDKRFTARYMYFLRQGVAHLPKEPLKKPSSAQLRVGYIGQIASHKGVHILVEAFLKLGQDAFQMQLKLYGDTTQFPDFYRYLQRLSVNQERIQFLGTFNNQQIDQVYEGIDVLVVPSIWYENSPNVILEAFAHQTPVIASNLGGMAELVTDHQTGLLFTPNNADDLAKKLRMLLDTPNILDDLQKNIAPPITLEAEMKELIQIYQAVLNKKADKLGDWAIIHPSQCGNQDVK